MELMEAIRTRRSVGAVQRDPVSREEVVQLLEAATWAPCHHHTEPWKFFVMTGEGRRALGKVLADIAREGMDDPQSEDNRKLLVAQESKPFRAPVVIAVAAVPSDHPQAVRQEELAAACAAVQNMLLAAHALGLGAIWRTGAPAYHPLMKQHFGLREQDEMLGFVYVGKTDREPPAGKRASYELKTVWIDS